MISRFQVKSIFSLGLLSHRVYLASSADWANSETMTEQKKIALMLKWWDVRGIMGSETGIRQCVISGGREIIAISALKRSMFYVIAYLLAVSKQF